LPQTKKSYKTHICSHTLMNMICVLFDTLTNHQKHPWDHEDSIGSEEEPLRLGTPGILQPGETRLLPT